MNLETILTEVQTRPAEQRLRLIEQLWDGLTDQESGPELDESLKNLIDSRLDALDRNPDAVVSWEQAEARAAERSRLD